jgi:hypothetical protein
MLLFLGRALAAGPVTLPCALDGLPDGALRWDPSGRVELLAPDGALVTRVETEMPSRGPPQLTCAGTRATIVLPPEHENPTFSLHRVRLDFAEHLASWARWDPVERACAGARGALGAGDPVAAASALTGAPPADPRVARLWRDVGHAATAGSADLPRLEAAVAALAAPGWSPAEARAVRLDHARALVATGRVDDGLAALRALEPRDGEVALAIADALWDRGDKAGAKEAYLAAAPLLASAPARVAERCPACRKALRGRGDR